MKQIIRYECDVSTKNPMRYRDRLSYFIISSRLLFSAFWILRLLRAMTTGILQIMNKNEIVRQIHTFYIFILISITFNRWFYR